MQNKKQTDNNQGKDSGSMRLQSADSPHTFHIPVMGTGFTIDTPLRLAKYGITSVVSIGDDILIEKMRKFYSRIYKRAYVAIGRNEEDARSRRITAYLNLLDELVAEQSAALQASDFSPRSDIVRYYNLLPDCPAKKDYLLMIEENDPERKEIFQQELRCKAVPGRIDVNIMTKADRDMYRKGVKLPPRYALAMSAMRGFANSNLRSAIVLSAGVNRRLFSYMSEFDDFLSIDGAPPKKKIIIKVSDYRSALIQGRMLARIGLWVSEFRIESGLNCGGHAFVGKGSLMGPILEEFLNSRESLVDQLSGEYRKALTKRGHSCPDVLPLQITAQGGIGTHAEHDFLLRHYHLHKTGWGTPFLLVPEATNVDAPHLRKLLAAKRDDVYLSDCSPLGVPFWNLKTSDSENIRKERIRLGKPGSPCPKGYLGAETEFSDFPLCHASRAYQKKRLEQLESENIPREKKDAAKRMVMSKSCICLDLAGGAEHKYSLSSTSSTAVCCGPGIADFTRVATLEEMLDHIYGRNSLMEACDRAHMFITELRLYLEYLLKEFKNSTEGLIDRTTKYFTELRQQIQDGIEYYHNLAKKLDQNEREKFLKDLKELMAEFKNVLVESHAPSLAPALAGLGRAAAIRRLS